MQYPRTERDTDSHEAKVAAKIRDYHRGPKGICSRALMPKVLFPEALRGDTSEGYSNGNEDDSEE